MIIVVGGTKGGSGKTTIATNLTVMRSATGKKVLLVDADEQRSTSYWIVQRKIHTPWSTQQISGKAIHTDVKKVMNKYDDIIIDVGGRDTTSQRSALAIADTYLIPFRPRSLDVWTLEDISEIVCKMKTANQKLRALSFINQGDCIGLDNQQAIDILKDYKDIQWGNVIIGNRKAFANAVGDGLGVVEMAKKDKKACEEIESLYQMLYGTCT